MQHQEMLSKYQSNEYWLYRQALRFTENEQDARDLIQDTLVSILKNAKSFTQGTNFMAWANTILRNTFINKYVQQEFYFAEEILSIFGHGYVTKIFDLPDFPRFFAESRSFSFSAKIFHDKIILLRIVLF